MNGELREHLPGAGGTWRVAAVTARAARAHASVCWAGLVGLLGLPGCGPTSFLITPVPRTQALQETVIGRESPWATQKLAVIDVEGVLTDRRERSWIGPEGHNPVATFKEKLDRAARDERVKAVILRIHSPGGGVTASDLMYSEVQRFRQQTGKPVIACLMDVAASGGYYLACAADRIYAHPTSVTGSIGVIMLAPEFSGTLRKLGVQANVIKSGELKDAGSPLREMTDRDREVFERIITQMYERFLRVVQRARPHIPEPRLRELADGRVFLAPDAKEHGLVDEIGDLPAVVAAAKQAVGVKAPVVLVQYARPLAYRANYYSQVPQSPAQVNLVNVELPDWLGGPGPQFLYLWAPGW